MRTLALKLLSYTEEKKVIEFSESEIASIHDMGELCGKLEILYSIQDTQNSILQIEIKKAKKHLIKAIKEIGMLDSEVVTNILNRIPLYFVDDDDGFQQLLSEVE